MPAGARPPKRFDPEQYRLVSANRIRPGKEMLGRQVAMLTRLVDHFDDEFERLDLGLHHSQPLQRGRRWGSSPSSPRLELELVLEPFPAPLQELVHPVRKTRKGAYAIDVRDLRKNACDSIRRFDPKRQ
jgi:hypothetical protein